MSPKVFLHVEFSNYGSAIRHSISIVPYAHNDYDDFVGTKTVGLGIDNPIIARDS